MYPFFRFFKALWSVRKAPALDIGQSHISHHICWPWDLDFWAELNNGRTLTLYDLGRVPMAQRLGLNQTLMDNRWGMSMAGASVRWRVRIKLFDRFEIHSKPIGWDDKFFYMEQSIWKPDGRCAGHMLCRAAVTDAKGIVAPQIVTAKIGHDIASPEFADWVLAWIAAENAKPWPPERGS